MSLRITRIELRNFRSYEDLEIAPDSRLTLLVGPNAAGKTNVIEAVRLLTAAESFRRPSWCELVRWGQEEARLSLVAEGEGRSLVTELRITSRGTKQFSVNDKVRRRTADVVGVLPSVVFTPDDLRMVKDSAEKRRYALDSIGEQLSPSYARIKSEYEKTLRQRNALFKEERIDSSVLRSVTEHLLLTGVRFAESRNRLFSRMVPETQAAHEEVAGDPGLSLEYIPSWRRDGLAVHGGEIHDDFSAALRLKEEEEKARRVTLVGPHRDDILFTLEGKDARAYASQGQQRTIALAWKLAEVRVTEQVSGQAPVLLLDDVMSELDESRRHALTDLVGVTTQTIVTTTNIGYFEPDLVSRAQVVRLG